MASVAFFGLNGMGSVMAARLLSAERGAPGAAGDERKLDQRLDRRRRAPARAIAPRRARRDQEATSRAARAVRKHAPTFAGESARGLVADVTLLAEGDEWSGESRVLDRVTPVQLLFATEAISPRASGIPTWRSWTEMGVATSPCPRFRSRTKRSGRP